MKPNFLSLGLAGAVALAAMAAAPALADDFSEVCPAKTAALNPEIADADAACACVAESADSDGLDELIAASSPDDLSESVKDAMRGCGYDV